MKKIHIHPGIQTEILKILNKEWDTTTDLEDQLGAAEKGFLCYEWTKAQEE